MNNKILVIDVNQDHLLVMLKFIQRLHAGTQVVSHNPKQKGMPGDDFNWAEYDLLLIDDYLGQYDGLDWLRKNVKKADFPPFIVISSVKDSGTMSAVAAVVTAIKLGAINFLFKKNFRIQKLGDDISSVLSGLEKNRSKAIVKKITARKKTARKKTWATSRKGSRRYEAMNRMQASVEDTADEVHLAMALLNSHEQWPFTIQDILDRKASIGDYKVISYLGSDMGSSTFKVRHKQNETPLIMYFIEHACSKEGCVPEEHQHELKVMKSTVHPNLMRLLDFQVIRKTMILIREFVSGETLHQGLSEHGFQQKQVVGYFREILLALEELHSHGITVGHFTPKSFRFGSDGALIFSNTGLIPRLHAIDKVHKSVITDTPAYSSPEEVRNLRLDHRSDLYVAGLIFYEMLAGVPAYQKNSYRDTLYAHVSESMPDLPDPGHPMNRIIQGLTRRIPGKRIQTAAEAHAMVDKIHLEQ